MLLRSASGITFVHAMMISPAKAFTTAYSQTSLVELYESHLALSKSVGIDRVTAEKFAANLKIETGIISKKALAGTYKFTAYRERLISKGADRFPRVISIPTIRDRLTLRTMCDLFTSTFPDAYAEIAQVKVKKLAAELTSKKYTHFVKIDVQQFYPSIDHEKLLATVRRRIKKKEALHLLTAALENPTVSERQGGKNAKKSKAGVAQGLSISNVLAEIYLHKFDQKYKQDANIFYSRYVDDIMILCDAEFECIAKDVISNLEKLSLEAHIAGPSGKSQQGSIEDGFDYLGYKFNENRISVRRSSILNIEQSIVKIFTSYKHALKKCKTDAERTVCVARLLWHLNLRLTGCIYKGQRLGWIFYFSQLNDTSVLRGIDSTVSSLLTRFKLPEYVKPKRILKAYYESSRVDKATHSYIPNFDETPLTAQISLLVSLGIPLLGKSPAQIAAIFRRKIGAAVSDLEKDLHQLS